MAGNYGITHTGDLLVSRLRDGTDLNEIWEDAINALVEFNQNRISIVNLISYQTTNAADAVYQNLTAPSFEQASEFGVSKSIAPPAEVLLCGFTRKDFDLRTEFTRFFLREADRRQVDAIINTAMASDNQNLTGSVLRRLFDPTRTHNEFGHVVFGLLDGLAPGAPDHLGQSFPVNTSHYLTTGNAVLDSLDIETAVDMIQDKGYGNAENGSHIIVFANPQEAKLIQSWRAGKESRPGGPLSSWDFIPSKASFPYLTDQQIVGELAPEDFGGLAVLGSFGPTWIVSSHFIPKKYLAIVASSGPNSENNPVGVRIHELPEHQGLKLIPGNHQGLPLIESFYTRCFGTGVRHRSAAVCYFIDAGSTYVAPTSLIPV